MARRPRLIVAGVPQHVVHRGNNHQAIFFAEEDYRSYLYYLHEAGEKHGCRIHHYVLMTNHVHLLVTPVDVDALPRTMQDLGRRYVQQRVNYVYERSGTLWEGRYKACLVDASRYFLTCCRYIELNPVRAGIVTAPELYRWSSYRHYAFGAPDRLLTRHSEYNALGLHCWERQEAYRALFGLSGDMAGLQEIRNATRRGWPFGSDRFKDQIEAILDREARPPKRGRPDVKCGSDPI